MEEADAVLSRPIGVPKTGVFGLIDLVGLDLMPLVGRSLKDALPESDAFHAVYDEPAFITEMIESGYIGRKGKGGFYRLKPDSEKKEKEVRDLATGEYGPAQRPRLESIEQAGRSLRALFEHPDKTGAYAWQVMSGTLAYAAGLVPEIADDVEAVDRAMRLGYNWKRGPFELIDSVSADWFAGKLAEEGREVPPLLRAAADGDGFYRVADGRADHLAGSGRYTPLSRPEGVLLLSDIKQTTKPLAKNASASLWDIGDGVACLEFHSKMNALDTEIMALVGQSVEIVGGGMTALVIHNEGSNFSVGMNLGLALFVVNVGAWPMIEETAKQGQDAFKALKFAPFPVVGAPSGMALGGGLRGAAALRRGAGPRRELHGPRRGRRRDRARLGRLQGDDVARAERRAARLRRRDARDLQGLRDHRPRQGLRAQPRRRGNSAFCARAMPSPPTETGCWPMPRRGRSSLAADYGPPEPATVKLPGKTGRIALKMAVRGLAKTRKATAHDLVVVEHLGNILTGGETDATREVSEDRLSDLEREALLALIRMPATIARMEHMLETGKPLRN